MTDEALPALKEILRRAVLTLGAVPDSDVGFRLGPKTAWPAFIRQARDAYGSAPPRVKSYQPTRVDLTWYLVVLSWLAWYRREFDNETPRIFTAWCLGAPIWQLQERVSTNRRRPCSPATVHNRMRGMCAVISVEFVTEVAKAIDAYPELANVGRQITDDDELSSDVRELPKSPVLWIADADPVELDPKRKARAHADLERVLKRNGSRARRRAERQARQAQS